jgi:hypothetical protein
MISSLTKLSSCSVRVGEDSACRLTLEYRLSLLGNLAQQDGRLISTRSRKFTPTGVGKMKRVIQHQRYNIPVHPHRRGEDGAVIAERVKEKGFTPTGVGKMERDVASNIF